MLRLLKRMRAREWGMALLCALLVLGQIQLDLMLPDYMSGLTVLVKTPGSTMGDIWLTGLKMLACTLGSAALAVICGYLSARCAAGLSYTLRQAIFGQVMDFSQAEMHGFSVPSLITRTTGDITQVQMLIAMGLQIMVKAPIMAVWAVIKILNKSWTLTAITGGFVAALLLMMVVVVIVIVPKMRKVQKLTDDINRVVREDLTGISVVHAYNAEEYQNEKARQANGSLMRIQLFNQRTFALLMPVIGLAMNALALLIYWVGAALVNQVAATDVMLRLETFSNVVVFGTYATYVVMSFMMMVMIIMLLPAAQVSAQRICAVLDAKTSLREGKTETAAEKGTVEFRNVSFRYPTSSGDILQDVSFKAARGETVAFIGATGSGKTTLVSLAARFYDATRGQVLVDGVDVRDYAYDALYDRIGFVTQKAVLFAGDVRDNVLFGQGQPDRSDAAVRQAVALAQAEEFVEKLPGELSAPITQSGANVSGGQKQRLSIARALARRPEILIFDDSFSALDFKTDAALRAGLEKDLADTTCLIVAQRIGTIRHADRIVVLDEGRAVGIGTHEELLKTCPVYREIALSQLSEDELDA